MMATRKPSKPDAPMTVRGPDGKPHKTDTMERNEAEAERQPEPDRKGLLSSLFPPPD